MRSAKAPKSAVQLALLQELQPPPRYWLLPPSTAGCRAQEFTAKQSTHVQNSAANADLPVPTLVVLPDLPIALVGEDLCVLPEFHFPSSQFRRQFFTD